MRPTDLKATNERAIRDAGPRYMPGQDPDAPNLQITSIVETFDGLGVTEAFRARVEDLRSRVQAAWRDTPTEFRAATSQLANSPNQLAANLRSLSTTTPAAAGTAAETVRRTAAAINRVTQRRIAALDAALAAAAPDSEAHRNLQSDTYRVRRFMTLVRSVLVFTDTASCNALATNRLLVLGRWGTGKTHSLCDVAERRMSSRLPTLLCLGQQLPVGVEPLEGLCRITGLATTPARLLRGLQRMGEQRNCRALLIVDAINEGDRISWKRALSALCRRLNQYPNVGLVLSCREPFNNQIFGLRGAQQFVTVYHQGFAEREFDAQLSFFDYYNIPAPHFPLITEEFARPLFLKLLCESIQHLSQPNKHRQLRHFASGQSGMTFLLERFVDRVGAAIEDDFGLTRGLCWRILKGDSPHPGAAAAGIAPSMATQPTDALTHDECLRAIEAFLDGPHLRRTARRLLQRMLSDGLLSEDARWTTTGSIPVVRFPYQRFGDHIIARHLLLQHLDTASETSIRRSFYSNRPLGRIFNVVPSGTAYEMPGLASALMVEFPERVRRRLPADERELVYYLPRRRQLVRPLKDAFLESLPWRSSDSFTQQTGRVVNVLLTGLDEYRRNDVVEVLVGLATREGHVYSAERLMQWLERMSMVERDLVWSEYIRHSGETAIVSRLLAWVERNAPARISEPAATAAARLLSLFLTSTVRPLRDRATRALFLIGLRHPAVLFATTLEVLRFNDPYVPERALAACYGVAMAHWADPAGDRLRQALPEFARTLARSMFVPPAPQGTRHALARGYALGTIAIAQKLARGIVATRYVRFLRTPFAQLPAPFRVGGLLTNAERAAVERAVQMDFGNYTLGTLVPGRHNYDDQNPDYRLVRDQVFGRIYELGYREELFGTIDRMIANYGGFERTQDGNRTDRYGKKYSWIAYFEMTGFRIDQGILTREWGDPSRADADLDPSFPEPAAMWIASLPSVFDGAPVDPIAWLRNGPTPQYRQLLSRTSVDGIRGPWVLLDGFVEQDVDVRRVFTFARGMLVRPEDIDALQEAFLHIPYPGNDAIPRLMEDHYTYAGEIPWSPQFATTLRRRGGRAKRRIDRTFGRWARGRDRGGVFVEVPAHEYSWGHSYSALNQNAGARVPTPSLCDALGLVNHGRTLNLYDGHGRRATLYRALKQRGDMQGRGSLLYIRAGLLRRYLRLTGQRLVWMVWGERNFTTGSGMHERHDVRNVWGDYEHIHRRFVVW